MTNLYDKSRQLRVHKAIIESQVKFGKDKATHFNKDKSKSRVKLPTTLENSEGEYI